MFIVAKDNPILHKSCEEVSRQVARSPQTARLARSMLDTMIKAKGVGLAAPQIGIDARLIVVLTAPQRFATFLNPTLSMWSAEEEEGEEGCLSLPGERYTVKRYKSITVVARSLKGKWEEKFEATGGFARILQHEIDHINGVLICDVGTKIEVPADEKVLTVEPQHVEAAAS